MAGNRKSKAKLAAARKAMRARASKPSSVTVSRRKMRGQTRYCVVAETGKRAKGFKGKGSTKRFHGCFIKPADAAARKKKLER